MLNESLDLDSDFNQMFSISDSSNFLFTDGSKSKDLPFTGFVIIDEFASNTYQFRSSNKASIFSCKAMAIRYALSVIGTDDYPTSKIFTDSMSVLKALCSKKRSNRYS